MYRIGVDVGGTNTDAVVMSGREVLAAVKVPTSADVTSGLMEALRAVQADSGITPAEVSLVVIGTTHFTIAVSERGHLAPSMHSAWASPTAACGVQCISARTMEH
jgi:N-methylhydantoinase A/oxoprolinase/acetone carboxylase beta subunit